MQQITQAIYLIKTLLQYLIKCEKYNYLNTLKALLQVNK